MLAAKLEELEPHLMVSAMECMGRCLKVSGRPDEADSMLRNAVTYSKQHAGLNSMSTINALTALVLSRIENRRVAQAEPICRLSLQVAKEFLGSHHEVTLERTRFLEHIA